MAKKKRRRQAHRDKPALASLIKRGEVPLKAALSENLLDSIAEIVHQGYGRLFDAGELRATLQGWQSNSLMNFEYVFAWKSEFDLSVLEIDWKRPMVRILREVIKSAGRKRKILSGTPMTEVEQQAYRLELARRKHGYQSAEECLDSGTDCKWVDLSFITDSEGRAVYILEIGDAASCDDENIHSMINRLEEIWRWKSQPLTIAGPFASSDEAEKWMAENGAFKEAN
jgi:hypothetical protein